MSALVRLAFLATLLALAGCQSAPGPTWQLPPQVKTLPANGYPMAYVERGNGPVVVLVHGAISDYRYWAPQLETLSARYRVVSVSLRHYYPEPWNGEGDKFTVETQAKDLAAFIERLGAGPVHVVAHSRGGSIGAGLAKLRPDLVKKLVLMEPSLLTLGPPAGSGGRDPKAIAAVVAERLRKGELDSASEYYVDSIGGPGTWKSRAEPDRQVVRDNAWTMVGGAWHADLVACDDLRAMRMPILLVESEKGPKFLRTILAEAAKCAPSAEHVLIRNAGHRMNRDNPAEFDAAVMRFLGS